MSLFREIYRFSCLIANDAERYRCVSSLHSSLWALLQQQNDFDALGSTISEYSEVHSKVC